MEKVKSIYINSSISAFEENASTWAFPSKYEYNNECGISTNSPISSFGLPNHMKIIEDFDQFIQLRTNYIQSLNSLGDNWIMDGSLQPNKKVIAWAINLLTSFNEWYLLENKEELKFLPPKIIIAPIPSGGIGFEWVVNIDHTIYVSLYNDDENVSLCRELVNIYNEYELPFSYVIEHMIFSTKEFSDKYAYSR